MRDCVNGEVRDRLPELVHGLLRGAEQSRVDAHVAECPDCAAEAALIRKASSVIALATPRMDVSRIAAAIASPTPGSTSARRPLTGRRGLQLAAALLVAVVSVSTLQLFAGRRAGNELASIERPLPAGNGERAVVRPITAPGTTYAVAPQVNRSGLVLVGGIDALTTDQLEVLISGVETLEAMPAAEPDLFPLAPNGAEESSR